MSIRKSLFELSHYVVLLIPTKKEKIKRFIEGLNFGIKIWIAQIDIEQRIGHVCGHGTYASEAKKPRGSGGFSGALFDGKEYYGSGHHGKIV